MSEFYDTENVETEALLARDDNSAFHWKYWTMISICYNLAGPDIECQFFNHKQKEAHYESFTGYNQLLKFPEN